MNKALSGATTPGQSRHWGDGNEGVLRIPQSSIITEVSPSGCLVSYPGHWLEKSYPSAEMQSVYSAPPADWTMFKMIRNFINILALKILIFLQYIF